MREPLFTETMQVALVVPDLDAAMRSTWTSTGSARGRSTSSTRTSSEMAKDDQPAEYAMRVALAKVGSVHWELIQPLDDRSMYAEFLAEKGEGLHHVAVGGARATTRRSRRCGRRGTGAAGRHVQRRQVRVPLDRRDLGVITEIFDWPEGLTQEPDAVYPPGGHSVLDPALEEVDLILGPGSVAGHRAVAKPPGDHVGVLDDVRGDSRDRRTPSSRRGLPL